MCHAAVRNGTTILTNEQLEMVDFQMRLAATEMGTVMIVTTVAVVGGVHLVNYITTIACADTDCTNELTTLYRAINNAELRYLNRVGNYGSSPSAGGKYFALTQNGVQQFANSAFNAGQNMTITSVQVPTSFVNTHGYYFYDVGGANASVHFAENVLPSLYQIMTKPIIIPGG